MLFLPCLFIPVIGAGVCDCWTLWKLQAGRVLLAWVFCGMWVPRKSSEDSVFDLGCYRTQAGLCTGINAQQTHAKVNIPQDSLPSPRSMPHLAEVSFGVFSACCTILISPLLEGVINSQKLGIQSGLGQ